MIKNGNDKLLEYVADNAHRIADIIMKIEFTYI